MRRLVYDCEIIRCISSKHQVQNPGLEYCKGWRDFDGMGVSVIGAMDIETHQPFIFMPDNLYDFQGLVKEYDLVCGFNNLAFDNMLLAASGIHVPEEKSYDLLVEIWKAAGLPGHFVGRKSGGYNLDAIVRANTEFGGKTGPGAQAPIEWQGKRYGKVANYCLDDVFFTCYLINLIERGDETSNPGKLIDPKTGEILTMPKPETATVKGV